MDYKIFRKEDLKHKITSEISSTELFIYPLNSNINSNFIFRISISKINSGTYPFIPFKNYNRFLFLIDGEIKFNLNNQDIFLTKNSSVNFLGNDNVSIFSNTTSSYFDLIYKNNVKILDFKFLSEGFSGKDLSSGNIILYYNIEKIKHISVNHNEYILNTGDVLVCCGNNFSIEESGKGILLILNIK